MDEPAANTHTPLGWPIVSIDLVPSGKAPKKYGDAVYRFGAAMTLSVLLPRRGWTLVKQTKSYAYLKPPEGEGGPSFRMQVAVPTDAECLAIAERSYVRGQSWMGQLGEWPAWYLHEANQDMRELSRDPERGALRSRIHRAPPQSSLRIGEWGAWEVNVTGVGGRFAVGILPPDGEANGANIKEQGEEAMSAAGNEMSADVTGGSSAAAQDVSEWQEWDDGENDPEHEYSEKEFKERWPLRVTLEYTSATEPGLGGTIRGPRAALYAHDASAKDLEAGDELQQKGVLLAVVTQSGIVTRPLGINSWHADFLEPRYGRVTVISLPKSKRWTVPKTVRRFDELIAQLPTGFTRYAGLGLGLKYEYRFILEAAQALPDVTELAFVHGDEMRVDGHRLVMGLSKFDQLRKAVDAIASRATRQSREDRINMVNNEVLHLLAPSDFPKRQRKLRPGEIYKLAELTSRQSKLTNKEMDAAAKVLSDAAPAIAKERPEKLLALSAEIETIALDELIVRMEAMMKQDLTEERWQAFFMANPFVISLALPYAVFVMGQQAHVGGTRLNGAGENIADYLFAQSFTGGLGVVEIKRPSHQLVTNRIFRGGVHAPHPRLTSAIAQVLGQKTQLTMNFAGKAVYDEDLLGKNVMNVHCVVVIGTTPGSKEQQRSFDLFRDAVKNVAVLTFDELLARIRDLRQLMSSKRAPEDDPDAIPF